MVNFLALLGWSPGTDQELFTADELIERFDLEGISGGNAVFNPEKLDWFNQQYIMRLPISELARRVEPWLRDAALWSDELASKPDWMNGLLELVRPRVKRLDQFAHELRPFLAATLDYDQAAVAKHLAKADIAPAFTALPDTLGALGPFESSTLETAFRTLADDHGIKAAALIHATRVAVTGRSVSPGLFDVLSLLGRERVIARLRSAQKYLTG